MKRFFVEQLHAGQVALNPSESAHAVRVMRLAVGDRVLLFDGRGTVAEAMLVTTDRRAVVCEVATEDLQHVEATDWQVVVSAPVAKGDGPEVMADMLSQVGASAWVPLICERSVVEPGTKKLEKWRRQMIESAKQCGRSHLMEIEEPAEFDQVIQRSATRRWLLHPDSATSIGQTSDVEGRVLLLVGPEGGFTAEEVERAQAAGFVAVGAGPYVMRIETAAVVGAAMILKGLRATGC